MDWLAVNGQAERHLRDAKGALQNANYHTEEAEKKLERARQIAAEIRDSRIGKDEDT